MHASDVRRAVTAAMSTASRLGLTADDAVILRDSNKLTARLVPCDVVARVAHVGHEVAAFEVELAERLGECRNLVLAMVAAWRCDPGDQLPDGPQQLHELLRALRDGPPWPAIDDICRGGATAGR